MGCRAYSPELAKGLLMEGRLYEVLGARGRSSARTVGLCQNGARVLLAGDSTR
jgi:hypothetical protein